MIEDELAHILTTVLLHAVLFLRSTQQKLRVSALLSYALSSLPPQKKYCCHYPSAHLRRSAAGNMVAMILPPSSRSETRGSAPGNVAASAATVRAGKQPVLQSVPRYVFPLRTRRGCRHGIGCCRLSKHRMGCCWLAKHRRGCSRFSIHRGCCGRLRYWKRQFLSRLWPCNRWQH